MSEAQLVPFCEELRTDERAKRRLKRKLDRERRANNPQNYDEKGRIKKTWQAAPDLEEQQGLSRHQTQTGAPGTQACRSSQESAWTIGA